jgi:hypothetical protein
LGRLRDIDRAAEVVPALEHHGSCVHADVRGSRTSCARSARGRPYGDRLARVDDLVWWKASRQC